MKFVYFQKVILIKGFYAGQEGKVIEYKRTLFNKDLYTVFLNIGLTLSKVSEDQMEAL